jgi:hypothetical protein
MPAERVDRYPASPHPLRGAIALEAELTGQFIRLHCELLEADLHAMEARLMLRFGILWAIFTVAAGILIATR